MINYWNLLSFFISFTIHCCFIWQITYIEMIKWIQGRVYYDELVIPTIENTAYESM